MAGARHRELLLEGRSALVTGAGRGLGRAIALRLASHGARVTVADIDRATAEATAKDIDAAGGRAVAVGADISVEAEVEAMVAAAVEAFGPLEIACNNAIGPVIRATMRDFDIADAQTTVAVNLLGTALCLKYELRSMTSEGDRSIVNISSTAPMRGEAGAGIYSACKAGIEGLTRVAANENGPLGIRVNAVAAGAMLTPALAQALDSMPGSQELIENKIPLRHIADPDEVADTVVFLCSDQSRYMTGSVLVADGGGMLHTSALQR